MSQQSSSSLSSSSSNSSISGDEDLYLRSLFAHNSPDACSGLFRGAQQEKQLKGVEGGFHTLYVGCLLKMLTKPSDPLNYCLPSFIKVPQNPIENSSDNNNTDQKTEAKIDDELSITKLKKVNECIGMDIQTTAHYLEELERVVSRKPAQALSHLNRISSIKNNLQLEESDSVDAIRNKVRSAVEMNCAETFNEIETAQSLDSQAYSMFKAHLCLFGSVCKRQFQNCVTTHTSHRSFAKCLENAEQMKCFKLYKDVDF
ncbi:hypothetical protein FDP41_010491 [Naegleria fowleri]|uniref:Uncharacterized protein n=1 Tax=Naegleria fowleri TaxID=5763 RepID=A0A6A5C6P5_NAEFO|nr:uncharacterized protein FDP41_010491 [Naegleria fowleri]KAF0983426.1 hypothetical protein FDP41_010491 [Naegleria fowleri]CAG4707959.1 unnamed protein product [Naegleria fowleri]